MSFDCSPITVTAVPVQCLFVSVTVLVIIIDMAYMYNNSCSTVHELCTALCVRVSNITRSIIQVGLSPIDPYHYAPIDIIILDG